ncbi:Acetolactate synthase small subunit [hydrothermal vent metagenome]|uniref:Acetolactate synthase small subunit n=1 Tax=hydrothermal vent metagenome TaxID=652676 RepID=A0A3B0WTH3_9ZZZZ
MVYEVDNSEAVEMKHIISILLENEAGALSRVAGLFSARAYNIESLTVAPTDDPSLSRMTVVTTGTDDIVEQVCKQLNKLIDVVKLVNLTDDVHVERELILIKLIAEDEQRDEVKRIVDIFHGHVIDMTDTTYTIEVTGDSEKIDAILKALAHITMLEVVRSGQLGMGRGDKGFV